MEQLALFAITKGYKKDDEAGSSKAAMGHGTEDSGEKSPENIETNFTDEENPRMHVAAFLGLEDEVKESIGLSSTRVMTSFGTWGSPLAAAAAGGHDNVLRLLKDVYAAPGPLPDMLKQKSSSAGSEGWTPLHWAASNGHASTCSILIEYGASLSRKSANGYTAWDLARDHGHDEVVMFLESFLIPRIIDEPWRTSSHSASSKQLRVLGQ
jgi:hypothetical protein